MNESHRQRGARAEELAARYLQTQGFEIIARNLRCKVGELDIVGIDAHCLAIVEVRQRRRTDYGGALSSVGWIKQRRIIRAANFFMQRRGEWRTRWLRFDVVALEGFPGEGHQIEWIKDAFRCA